MKSHPRAAGLAAAVAERDRDRLGVELTDDVRLRALLPSGPIEVHGREATLAAFQEWFGDHASVVLAESSGDEVGDRLLVHYRLLFEEEAERTTLTQTWVATVAADGRLARVDLLCSGFRRC
jgi:SnoaL-like domain